MAATTDPESSIEVISPSAQTAGKGHTEPPAAKPADSPTEREVVHLKMRKRTLWSLIVTGLIIVAGVTAWYTDAYGKLSNLYNTTSATVVVKEDGTLPLADVTVEVGDSTYTTDATGRVEITKIVAGSYRLTATKEGYGPVVEDWTITRGENAPKEISISKRKNPVYTLEGMVRDYVSELPLADVSVSLQGETVRTNPAGQFTFNELEAGEYGLTLSKSGFITKDQTVTLSAEVSGPTIDLVPNGQVVFVSNREGGKQGIYTSRYDGTEQRRLIENAGGEDFGPLLSPDGRYVAFLSTRDGLKDRYNSEAFRLYVANRDGSDVRKVGDEIAVSAVRWSPDGRYLFFYAAVDTEYSAYVSRVYRLDSGSVFVLEDNLRSPEQVLFGEQDVLYYTSSSGGSLYEGTGTLVSINLENGERRSLYSWDATQAGSLSGLRLTTDGRSLTFKLSRFGENEAFYRLNLATLTPEVLSSDPVDKRRVGSVASPDGKLAAFVANRDGKEDVFTLDPTNVEKRLTSLGGFVTVPRISWDQSMRYVVVANRQSNETALYVISVEGGASKKVVDFYIGFFDYGGYY